MDAAQQVALEAWRQVIAMAKVQYYASSELYHTYTKYAEVHQGACTEQRAWETLETVKGYAMDGMFSLVVECFFFGVEARINALSHVRDGL